MSKLRPMETSGGEKPSRIWVVTPEDDLEDATVHVNVDPADETDAAGQLAQLLEEAAKRAREVTIPIPSRGFIGFLPKPTLFVTSGRTETVSISGRESKDSRGGINE